MGYIYYAPQVKVIAVRMRLAGCSHGQIQRRIGKAVSKETVRIWARLFRLTRSVMRNPTSYRPRGRPRAYKPRDVLYIKALVKSQPHLFLSEIREKTYDKTGTLPATSTLQLELCDRLGISLKTAQVSSVRKDHMAKLRWMDQVINYPSELLVFTGKLLCFPNTYQFDGSQLMHPICLPFH